MLVARNLTKSYPSGGGILTVLRDVSFVVPEGAFVAIVGPSGSGKTTLLGLLAGLDIPTSGSVSLDGTDLGSLTEDARARLRGLSVEAMRANIQGIIDTVRSAHPDARIVLAGMEAPPNLGARYTAEFRETFPEIARANHATLIPFLLDGVAGVDSLNQADGIHPNPAGARVVADNVWRVLRPVLVSGAKAAGG